MNNSSSSPRQAQQQVRRGGPRLTLDEHQAAVKAVAWCPWQRNILASGGGTADRTIRIWDASADNTSCCLRSVDTGSQVCALQWLDYNHGSYHAGSQSTGRELVSSHGFSDNQLIVWRYRDMSRVAELRRHEARVLHLTKSPCGNVLCSGSADETLCFWDVSDRSGSGQGSGNGGNGAKSPLPLAMTPSRRGLYRPLISSLSTTPGGSLVIR